VERIPEGDCALGLGSAPLAAGKERGFPGSDDALLLAPGGLAALDGAGETGDLGFAVFLAGPA
jgi:hypothetical protein